MEDTGSIELQVNNVAADAPATAGSLVERLLREPDGIWRQITAERELGALTRQLLLATALPLSVQGAVLGASSGILQALSSAVKLPLLPFTGMGMGVRTSRDTGSEPSSSMSLIGVKPA